MGKDRGGFTLAKLLKAKAVLDRAEVPLGRALVYDPKTFRLLNPDLEARAFDAKIIRRMMEKPDGQAGA